jgi:SNF2 family DNA or RNA helicase
MQDYNPLPFQQNAIALVCEQPGSALLLDPGMGKTAITLAAHCVLQHHKAIDATLVIVPLRPLHLTWPAEVKKWKQFSHLKVSIIHGTAKQRLAAVEAKADIYLINPENTAWLVALLNGSLGLFGTKPGFLVVDESTRYKNSQSVRFKALKTILPLFGRRTILTGTPAPQGIEDLFAQFQIVDDGKRLGRFVTYFRKLFMFNRPKHIGGGRYVDDWYLRPGGERMVADAIKDVSLRLQAEDYLKMPAVSYNIIPVELPAAARATYRKLEGDLVATTSKGVTLTAVTAAAAVMKLRQITNGWAYHEGGSTQVHDAKLDALADLVEEQSGQPVLVAVAFVHEVEAIREVLAKVLPKGTKVPYLGGGVTRLEADRIMADWNDGETPVLLAHPTSVAHGLNLQSGGHTVCWFGLTWNLEEHIQFNARVYRQGQTKPVVIHYLTAKDTVDESIAAALSSKSDLQSAILNRLKGAKQ